VQLTSDDIRRMAPRRRAAFVNSLTGFKPANLVGTVSADGRTNLAIMSSAVHLGSDPALLALVIRPGGEERHTLANILARGYYSLNHVTSDIIEQAHQTAARYPQDTCEFAATGLTARWVDGFAAPLVAEAGLQIGLQLREHQKLAINGTHLVIGEVVLVELQPSWLDDAGGVNPVRSDSVALSGLDTYHAARPLKQMAYAKPDLPPRALWRAGQADNLDINSTARDDSPAVTQTGDARKTSPANTGHTAN
jgi:flavin reductase (DIM6/NTAB) family NADH-FMN oxidoreductase RutF